jgi:nucleoid-associated protein YejK
MLSTNFIYEETEPIHRSEIGKRVYTSGSRGGLTIDQETCLLERIKFELERSSVIKQITVEVNNN